MDKNDEVFELSTYRPSPSITAGRESCRDRVLSDKSGSDLTVYNTSTQIGEMSHITGTTLPFGIYQQGVCLKILKVIRDSSFYFVATLYQGSTHQSTTSENRSQTVNCRSTKKSNRNRTGISAYTQSQSSKYATFLVIVSGSY